MGGGDSLFRCEVYFKYILSAHSAFVRDLDYSSLGLRSTLSASRYSPERILIHEPALHTRADLNTPSSGDFSPQPLCLLDSDSCLEPRGQAQRCTPLAGSLGGEFQCIAGRSNRWSSAGNSPPLLFIAPLPPPPAKGLMNSFTCS